MLLKKAKHKFFYSSGMKRFSLFMFSVLFLSLIIGCFGNDSQNNQGNSKYPLGAIPLESDVYDKYLKKQIFQTRSGGTIPLPDSYNAKDDGIVSPSRNQSSCGSCWSFAVTGAFEAHMLKSNLVEFPVDLSEQQQVSCNTEQGACLGGNMLSLLFWETQGPITESCFPYTGSEVASCEDSIGCAQFNYRVNAFHTINTLDPEEVKASVYNNGPSWFGYRVCSDFLTFWEDGLPGNVYINEPGNEYEGGHAVLIIGWDDNKGAYLCKNSWWDETGDPDGILNDKGPNEDGTFWIAYDGHSEDLGFQVANFDLIRSDTAFNEDIYEPDNDPATVTNSIATWGIAQYHTFHESGDQDFIKLDLTGLTGRSSLKIETFFATERADAYMYILNSNYDIVESGLPSESKEGYIYVYLDNIYADDVYYIMVFDYHNSQGGDYLINVKEVSRNISSEDSYEMDDDDVYVTEKNKIAPGGPAQYHTVYTDKEHTGSFKNTDEDYLELDLTGIPAGTQLKIETYYATRPTDTSMLLIAVNEVEAVTLAQDNVVVEEGDNWQGYAVFEWVSEDPAVTGSKYYIDTFNWMGVLTFFDLTPYKIYNDELDYLIDVQIVGENPSVPVDIYEEMNDNEYNQTLNIIMPGDLVQYHTLDSGDQGYMGTAAADYIKIEDIIVGKKIKVETYPGKYGSDTYIGLYDSNFNLLAQDDNSGEDLYSQVILQCSVSGPYYLLVRSADSGTGDYLVDIQKVIETPPLGNDIYEPDGDLTTVNSISPGSLTQYHTLLYPGSGEGDVDVINLDLANVQEGTPINVNTYFASDLADTFVCIADSTGMCIAYDETSGDDYSEVNWICENPNENYYIIVLLYDVSEDGDYLIDVQVSVESPVNVSATDGDYNDKVVITSDRVIDADYYRIYRSTSENGTYTQISGDLTAPYFEDTDCDFGTYYYYKVKAINNSSESSYSEPDQGYSGVIGCGG